jgi:cytochrome b6-f complex iron-sulfur subunit
MDMTSSLPSRRAILTVTTAAGSVGALTACSPFQDFTGAQGASPAPVATDGTPTRVGKLSDVPVGGSASGEAGGQKILVHRPDETTVLAYSAVCTHQGCAVNATDSEFACPCHNSTFAFDDGTVTGGPAPAPLPRYAAAIDGDWITVTV